MKNIKNIEELKMKDIEMRELNDKELNKLKEIGDSDSNSYEFEKSVSLLLDAAYKQYEDYEAYKAVSLALDTAARKAVADAANEVMATAIASETIYTPNTVNEAYTIAKSITDIARTCADEAAIDYEAAHDKADTLYASL